MTNGWIIELAAACSDVQAARRVAQRLGGLFYADERAGARDLPFRALFTTVTDDPEALADVADVGQYVVCRRPMKPGSSPVVALFPMLRRPDLSHRQSDAHWRDVHAPLALTHHGFMTSYFQLSVIHCLAGRDFDGFALCGFDSLEDLRQRFYSGSDSATVIAADVKRMADVERSPRRLITLPQSYPYPHGQG